MKFIRRFLTFLLLCLLCTGAFFGYRGYERYREALEAVSLDKKVAEIQSNPSYTPITDLPQVYLDAVVAVEDKRFYKHPGFDIISIGRAVKNDIEAGQLIEGGSTITQQLAKNMYFSQERSITRKAAELFMALKLERNYDKKEILELYVNSIYFGDTYYCVADASRGYFNKEPRDMNAYESTMLAGIPNAPSAYSPDVSPELAHLRQEKVIQSMIKQKYLTREEANQILDTAARQDVAAE